MNEPSIVSQKSVFKTDLFEVKKLNLILPNKKTRTYDVIKRRPSVFIFPITESYELYLIYQYRYLLGKIPLEAVAGFINNNESSLSAAKRELKEETGIKAGQWEEFARIEMSNSIIRAQGYLFLAKDLEMGESAPEEGEQIKLAKMPFNQAIRKIMEGEICDAGTITGILMLDQLRREKKL